MLRGPTLVVPETRPKSALPNVVLARPNCGVFVTLNISARNWAFIRSRKRKFLSMAKSAWFVGPKRMFGVQRGLRHLLRLQAGSGRLAVARRHRHRHRQPQPALLEAQQLRKPHLQHDDLAGLQVADVGGVQAAAQRFQQHRRMAFAQRLFIARFGFAAGDDLALHALAVQL